MANEQAVVLALLGLSYLAVAKSDFLKAGLWGKWSKMIFFNFSIFVDMALLLMLIDIYPSMEHVFASLFVMAFAVIFLPNLLLTVVYLTVGFFKENLQQQKRSINMVFGQID